MRVHHRCLRTCHGNVIPVARLLFQRLRLAKHRPSLAHPRDAVATHLQPPDLIHLDADAMCFVQQALEFFHRHGRWRCKESGRFLSPRRRHLMLLVQQLNLAVRDANKRRNLRKQLFHLGKCGKLDVAPVRLPSRRALSQAVHDAIQPHLRNVDNSRDLPQRRKRHPGRAPLSMVGHKLVERHLIAAPCTSQDLGRSNLPLRGKVAARLHVFEQLRHRRRRPLRRLRRIRTSHLRRMPCYRRRHQRIFEFVQ
mmetsp:Transcript_6935/g.17934  ORF Transcript_6935/g.17934 Transcript_6935/m.17934 type:complete len:252 (+) Transcript_6935:1785-2540(+)